MVCIWLVFLLLLQIHWSILRTFQRVDSAALDEKGLLVGRSQYSLQLKDYLEQHEEGTNRTCFMFFNTKKKKLEKEIHKLKVKYQKGNTLVLKDLGSSFRFEKAVVE